MPEVYDRFSGDASIYTMIKNTGDWICDLEPNHITLLNMGVTVAIGYLLLRNRNQYLLYGLVVLRSVLDILDGGVARKCDKQSDMGKYLDNIGDLLFVLVLCYVVMTRVKAPYRYIRYAGYPLIAFAIYVTYRNCVDNYELNESLGILRYVQDNTVFLSIIVMYGVLQVTD